METLRCVYCGSGELSADGGDKYRCSYCNSVLSDESMKSDADRIREIFSDALAEQKEEQIANLRRLLYEAVTRKYNSGEEITVACRELKKLLPDDAQANFFEEVASGDAERINKKLSTFDIKTGYPDYFINFALGAMTEKTMLAVGRFIERAYKKSDVTKYAEWQQKFEKLKEDLDSAVYDTATPRDVFVAYSSVDMPKVIELVDYLESQGLSCFVALRNLRHSDGAAHKYEERLHEAIDNCKFIVLVSSNASRTKSEARDELKYIKGKDREGAPAKYKNDYKNMPDVYKKPRVEYLIEDYSGSPAELLVKEFFGKLEYRCTPLQVAETIYQILDNPPEEEDDGALDELAAMRETINSLKSAIDSKPAVSYVAPSAPPVPKFDSEGFKNLVRNRRYTEAKNIIMSADDVTDPEVWYYAAAAMLEGKKAFLATRQTIDTAMEYLNKAISMRAEGRFYYFLAYIKYDYFERKYLNTSPNYRTLLSAAVSYGVTVSQINALYGLLGVSRPSCL